MKVMIATGGTGGHIYPATSLAQILKEELPQVDICFLGTTNRMEAKLLPSLGYRYYGVYMLGTNGGIIKKMQSMLSLGRAYFTCRQILKKEKPDIVIGFGNYISVPLLLCASHLHIPTMIHEQNCFPGKANAFLAKHVDAIVGCYAINQQQFPQDKFYLYGNPQATLASRTTFDPSQLDQLGLDRHKPFILCMMGSLGSSSVSKAIDELIPLLDESLQMVVSVGKSNEYTFQNHRKNVAIVDYVDGKSLLKGCQFAILRSGATTMAEVCVIGTPAIYIPSPYVANNEQLYNAQQVTNVHGGILLEEKNLTAQALLDAIQQLAFQSDRLYQMSIQTKKQGFPQAAYDMIEKIKELVNE